MDQFSIRVLTLESTLRVAHFAVEEAKHCRNQLLSRSIKKQQQGRESTIKLLRYLRGQVLDYKNLRGSFSSRRIGEELVNELKEISNESTWLLAKIKRTWDRQRILKILRRILSQEKKVDAILKKIKRRTPNSSNYFYAGIDGGATKTKAVISDSYGNILAEAKSGPCEPRLVGMIKSFDSLITSLKKATKKAGLNFETTRFRRICAGLAGISTKHIRINELMSGYTAKFYPNIEEAIIIPDSLLALYGAFRGKPGILSIGGTGHKVFGYNNDLQSGSFMKDVGKELNRDLGKVARLGARFIVNSAAKKIIKKLNQKKATILTRNFKEALRGVDKSFKKTMESIESGMYARSGRFNDRQTAGMAKVVVKSAKQGDSDAIKVIHEATETTSIIISIVASRIKLHNKPFPVAYVGSVVRQPFVLHNLKKNLEIFEPRAYLVKPELEPTIAAIEIARKNIQFY